MALMAAIFRLHRPITTQQVVVSGHKVTKKTVVAPAKAYVLPANPGLQQPRSHPTNQ
jgi:hypothetical protein